MVLYGLRTSWRLRVQPGLIEEMRSRPFGGQPSIFWQNTLADKAIHIDTDDMALAICEPREAPTQGTRKNDFQRFVDAVDGFFGFSRFFPVRLHGRTYYHKLPVLHQRAFDLTQFINPLEFICSVIRAAASDQRPAIVEDARR